MKELLILRHAKSSRKDESLEDHERPLNKRGKRDAPRMGRLMQSEGMAPQRIITSSARRAVDTAERLVKSYEGTVELVAEPRLYTGDAAGYLNVLAEQHDGLGSVLIVGHNPTIESLIELLIGTTEQMPTAALARVELPLESWSRIEPTTRGRLVGVWRPKELPAD